MSNETETVKFNIGGRHFEVSRGLIDGHSETVLGKLVSDNWNDNQDKAVFIDRSGDLFANVLEYLRYGSIELPITIPRSMFERELDYYGITSFKDRIADQSLARTSTSLAKDFEKVKRKYEMYLLAIECYSQFSQSRNAAIGDSVKVEIPKGHNLFNDKRPPLESGEWKLLGEYLHKYFGLMVDYKTTFSLNGDSFFVFVRVKE